MRGRLITFEGGEGSGKTTQVRRLAERLRLLGGREVIETREPGGSPGAEAIRHILLQGVAKPMGTEAEAMLFAAARDDHMGDDDPPGAGARGRGWFATASSISTRVYQGALGNVDPRLIRELERVVVGSGHARSHDHVSMCRRRPASSACARAAVSPNCFEGRADLQFHRAAARRLSRGSPRNEPERCVLIDASGTRLEVADQIWTVVNKRLDPATAPVALEGVAS